MVPEVCSICGKREKYQARFHPEVLTTVCHFCHDVTFTRQGQEPKYFNVHKENIGDWENV